MSKATINEPGRNFLPKNLVRDSCIVAIEDLKTRQFKIRKRQNQSSALHSTIFSGISKQIASKNKKRIPFCNRNSTGSKIKKNQFQDNYPCLSENECLFKVDEQPVGIQSKSAITTLNYRISSTIDSIPVQQANLNSNKKITNINNEDTGNTIPQNTLSDHIENSSLFSHSNRIAEFLAKQIHKFHGCSLQQHIQSSKDTTNIDQEFGYKTIAPCSICPEDFGVNIPSVMDKDTFLQSSHIQLSTSDLNRVYCGLSGEDGNIPVKVSFAMEDLESSFFEIHQNSTFDIDSVMALPQSLAVAKQGLKVYFYPPRFMNIQKDLHLRFCVLNPKTNRNNTVTIQKIPHFLLGQFFGFGELKLFLFFPKLYCPDKQTNFLTDSDMERFYNRLLLPAIYSTCPSDIIQRIPASLAKAKQNSFARGTESKNKKTNTFGFSQMIGYLLAPCYLPNIWRYMQIHSSDHGLQDFGDMFLFLDGKDFKTITRFSNPVKCFRSFFDFWSVTCDERHLDPNTTWLDYGKEVVNDCSVISPYVSGQSYELRGSTQAPLTYLWRKCCLESYAKQIATEDSSGTQSTVFYPWALSNDVCNMTITPKRNSVFWKAGLIYSQFYTITHEIFKAGKTYPFEDDSLEGLAVDTKLAASWLNVGGGSKWNMDSIKEGYLASKKRCNEAILTDCTKSLGIREEHRVTMSLLSTITSNLETKQYKNSSSNSQQHQRSFWVHQTPDIMLYLLTNLNKYAFAFEYTLSQIPKNDMISWENTRFMVMLLRILRVSYGGGIISKEAGLWNNERKGGMWGDIGMEGMNFQDTIQKRGYAWLPAHKIDWIHCTFSEQHSNKIPFNNNSLLCSYRKRCAAVQTITGLSREFGLILNSLEKHSGNKYYWYYTLKYLSSKCIVQYRQEVWRKTVEDYGDEDMEQCLLGYVGMSVEGLRKRAIREVKPHFTTSSNRYRFTPMSQAQYLWCCDDDQDRNSWENKSFRLLFKQVFTFLNGKYGPTVANTWSKKHCKQFLQYNWVFPQPVKSRFYQTIDTKDVIRQRIWYSTIQTPITEKRDSHRLNKEGSGRFGFYQPGEPDTMPMQFISTASYLEVTLGAEVDKERLRDLIQYQHIN